MRKLNNRGSAGEGFCIALVVVLIFLFLCHACSGQNQARNWGGEMTITLEPGVKLEEITWKDEDTLWYVTRPMREDEFAETHTFQADTVFGVFEGEITIVEQEAK